MEKDKAEAFKRATDKYTVEMPAVDLEARVKESFKIRGVSMASASKIGEIVGNGGGTKAIWSKTYTETNSNRLITPSGDVLFETNTPLTQAENDLIEELNLRETFKKK